jgi:hypothetical protein
MHDETKPRAATVSEWTEHVNSQTFLLSSSLEMSPFLKSNMLQLAERLLEEQGS